MLEILLGLSAAAAVIGVGGGLYEFSVVDPVWPKRIELVQPAKGGISRKRFWIASHTVFELLLIASLIVTWSLPDVRFWLLVALASHATMRIWSAFYFIPKALAFEKSGDAPISMTDARQWTRLSRLRLPLDLVTCFAMFSAFAHFVSLETSLA